MQTEVKEVHEGRNIKRIREILGMKQETLALQLGISQQSISSLEQREALDKETLDKVAKALKVPVEAIKNFNEETAVNFISSTFNNSGLFNYNCSLTFNPFDKVVELYEALLKSEREKIALLEKMLNK